MGRYDVIGFRATVECDSREFLTLLDRLNAHFQIEAQTGEDPATNATYVVRSGPTWEVPHSAT